MSRPRLVDVLVLSANAERVRLERININDYRELNRLVEGNLGSFGLPPSLRRRGFYAYCDDDGLVRADAPAPNPHAIHLGQARLAGPIVILRADERGTEHGLTPADIDFWRAYLAADPPREALQLALQSAQWWLAHPAGFVVEGADTLDELFKKLSELP
jgi:hypothetical protein